ncbi:hypothetical protein ACJQWK_07599 [Exserohilum turcicum]
MPPLPTSKRSACDRCRLQKLRCPPSVDGTETCTRCKRLGARCITSYPRRPNGAQQTTQSQGQPELRPKLVHGLQFPASTVASTPAMSTPSTIVTAPMNTSTTYQPTSYVTNMDISYDSLPSSLDDASDRFSSQAGSLRLDSWGLSNDDAMSGFLTNDSPSFHSPPTFEIDGSGSSADFPDSFGHMQVGCMDTTSHGQHSHILECNARLCNLNLDLSKRLQECLGTTPQGSPRLYNAKPEDGSTGDRDGINTTLERALGDLSEFIAVIRSYVSTRNDFDRGNPTGEPIGQGVGSGPGISATPKISLVFLINLLSAYLQLVTIYDKIFSPHRTRLCSTASLEPSCTSPSQQPLDFRLLGLSAAQGTLQTKILIHAILHQFDVIERMLGLPADLRVTDTQDVYLGLFEDERARSLLGAVSNAKRIETSWAQAQFNMEDYGGANALSALRMTLKVMQGFLDT